MIEKIIDYVLQSTRPATEGELGAFRLDARLYMENCDELCRVVVTTTTNKRCLIEAYAEVSSTVQELPAVSEVLLMLWNNLGYSHFAAKQLEFSSDAGILRFITVPSSESWCISGNIQLAGAHYDRLFHRQYEQGSVT